MNLQPTFGPPPRQQIDQRRLRQLRLDRLLSTRHIAKETGIEPMNYHRLESAENPNLSTLTVAALLRLADYLRVPAGHLFTYPDNPDQSIAIDPRSQPESDARTLGALLHALDTKANKTALADSLAWTLERLHAASDVLNLHLASVGMTLFDADGRLWLGPLHDEHADAETRFRQHRMATPKQRLLTAARARILHAAATGGYEPTKGGNEERFALAGLMRAGLLTATGNTYTPTAEVVYSLDPLARRLGSSHDTASPYPGSGGDDRSVRTGGGASRRDTQPSMQP